MKASTVLRLYAAGKRDFQKVNLRGQNLSGANLSGADFSDAELYGTNFSDTILKNTIFIGAKCGLQRRWKIFLCICFRSITFLCIFVALTVPIGISIGVIEEVKIVLNIGLIVGIILFTGAILGAILCEEVISLVHTGQFGQKKSIVNVLTFLPMAVYIILFIAALFLVAAQGVITLAKAVEGTGAIGLILLSSYYLWEIIKQSKYFRDDWIEYVAITLASFKDTSFRNADLTKANFSKAKLKGADFRKANLSYICWNDAKLFERVRCENTYLKNNQIRQLVITRNGQENKFDNQDLRRLNLRDTILTKASFSGADLSEADLQNADLSKADFLDTNLNSANLTGICIKDWNINNNTDLNNIVCDYVYFETGQKERRPHNPDKNFEPGDFYTLVQKALNTVDLLFSDGIDWQAFLRSFYKIQVESAHGELAIQAIEKKTGQAFVIRVEVPRDANKKEIEEKFYKKYKLELAIQKKKYKKKLKAKNKDISDYEKRNTELMEIIKFQAQKQVDIIVDIIINNMNKNMSNDRKTEISGIVNASGAGAFNLGDISGTVANNINQIPDSSEPNKPNIKQLLSRLKEAIETESHLEDFDKQDALEEVNNLAQASQKEIGNEQKNQSQKYLRNLARIAKALPAGAALVTICKEVLPAIAKFFE